MRSIEERFEANVDRRGAHHRWLGTCDSDGTPQIRVNGRLTTARRVAWQLTRGPLPPKVTVAACEADSTCVRAEHLGLGRRRRFAPPPIAPSPLRTRSRAGSIREVGAGVWELAVTSADGSGRRYRRIHGNRHDAIGALATFTVEHGGHAATADALVAGYLAHLQTAGRHTTTLRRYHQLWRQWLAPDLGHLPPNSLSKTNIERTLKNMAAAGQSPSSIHQAAVVFSDALTWAHDNQRLHRKPTLNLRLPNGTLLGPPRHRIHDGGL